GSPDSSQKTFQISLSKQLQRLLPILMNCQGQLIEVAANSPRGKNELVRKWLRAAVDWAAIATMPAQGAAVIVAIIRLVRIDPRTLDARLGHSSGVLGHLSLVIGRLVPKLHLFFSRDQ